MNDSSENIEDDNPYPSPWEAPSAQSGTRPVPNRQNPRLQQGALGGSSRPLGAPPPVAHTIRIGKGVWILAATALFLIVVAIAVFDGNDGDDGDDTSPTVLTVPPSGVLAFEQVGASASLLYTVHSATDPWIPTNQYQSPGPGRRFVAVEMTVENVADRQATIVADVLLEIIDSTGRSWDAVPAGAEVPNVEGRLPAGAHVRGWVIFEVADDSTGLTLVARGALDAAPVTFRLSP